jgi:hypothetical protein
VRERERGGEKKCLFADHAAQPRENQRPTMLLAMLPARLPELKALPARLEAWLNLSHREKASVFMIVKTSAMTVEFSISKDGCKKHDCHRLASHE